MFSYKLSLLLPVLFVACQQPPTTPAVDMAAEDAAIRSVIDQMYSNIEAQDFDAVATICTDDWVFFNNAGSIWTLQELASFFAENITEHTIEISNIELVVSDDATVAWVSMEEDTEYLFRGEPMSEHALFTGGLVKEADGWKVGHLHRSVRIEQAVEEEM